MWIHSIAYRRGRQPLARVPIMAREVVKLFQKHFFNFETIKNLHSAQNKRLICCVLLYCLFSHHYFFITAISSLLCTLVFYTVGNPEVNRQVCGQEVKIRCEIISRVVDSWCFWFVCRNDIPVCTIVVNRPKMLGPTGPESKFISQSEPDLSPKSKTPH